MSTQQPFNPKLVAGLIVSGIVAFVVLLLLVAYGGGIGSGRDGRAHALSVSAVGFKGMVQLVDEFREAHLDETASEWSDHLLIVTLEERNNPADLARLLEQRADYPTLIILPKWLTMNDPARRGWVRALAPGAGGSMGSWFGKGTSVSLSRGQAPLRVNGANILEGIDYPVPRSPQQIEGPNLTPLASLPRGGALIAQVGDEPHYVLADPDLFNNHGLRDPARARAALATIERLNGEGEFVDFDVSLNGFGSASRSPSLLRLAFEPPFLVMTLALFFAALLAGLHGAFRFGPARREERAIAFGKAALVENSAGLIRLARREANLGAAYVDVVRQEAARTASAAPVLQGEALDAYLDRLSRPGQPSFSDLVAQFSGARDRHSLMVAARALVQWKKEITP